MRWILITTLLPIIANLSWATKRMTVAQLEQVQSTRKAAHKSDIEKSRTDEHDPNSSASQK